MTFWICLLSTQTTPLSDYGLKPKGDYDGMVPNQDGLPERKSDYGLKPKGDYDTQTAGSGIRFASSDYGLKPKGDYD